MSKRNVVLALSGLAVAVVATVFITSNKTPETAASADGGLTHVVVQLGWFAEPEYGGEYAALSKGFFTEAGLDVVINPGGPRINGRQIVASGKADFGFAKSDTVLQNREEGLPLVAVAAALQDSPQGLIYRADQPLQSFADIKERKVFFVPGVAAYEYVKKKFDLHPNEQSRDGSLAQFIADPASLLHGFETSEPFTLAEQGIATQVLKFSDAGYSPYEITIITSQQYLQNNPDTVRAYLQAVSKGWAYYFEHVEEINQYIHQVNPELPVASMNQQAAAYKPLVLGGDAATEGFGVMKAARWERIKQQLLETGLLRKDADVHDAFTLDYLPK